MKANLLKTVFVIAIAMIAGINVHNAQKTETMSDVAKANVEALADNEGSGLEPGPYNIRERFTDEYYNGILYHQEKIVTCYPGGDYACKEGKYYRNKKDNGQWGNWIPV